MQQTESVFPFFLASLNSSTNVALRRSVIAVAKQFEKRTFH